MEGSRVHLKAIRRAAEIVGGTLALSLRLDVSRQELEEWLTGRGAPSDSVFLCAVDIILQHDGRVPWTKAELDAELGGRLGQRK